jgi:photosystem II stability/assembly factor-like uncharacterized protein
MITKIKDMNKFCILLLAIFAINCSKNEEKTPAWVIQTSGTNKSLWSVCFTDTNTVYAVGDSGIILKTTNGGNKWTTQYSGTTDTLKSVNFPDTDNGYAVGYNGTIIKTTDRGINWEIQTSGTIENLNSVYFPDIDTGYAVGVRGIILKTTNGGTNWTIIKYHPDSSLFFTSVFFLNAINGYVVGGGTGLYSVDPVILRTTDGGSSWTKLYISLYHETLKSVFFLKNNTGYVVGDFGWIGASFNGGNDWVMLFRGWSWNSIYFTRRVTGYGYAVNTGYAVGTFGWIFKTTNGGIDWTRQVSGTGENLHSVCFPNENTGYVVGYKGIILKTTTGGTGSK